MTRGVTSLLCAVALAMSAQAAVAQPATGGGAEPALTIDDHVAKWLHERGLELYTDGDYANAKKMFIESLERSPEGPTADESLSMLRSANERLGVVDLDDGVPTPGATIERPIDPYGGGDVPLDPYADPNTSEPAPIDPYAAGAPVDTGGDGSAVGRKALLGWSGAYGMVAGLAIAGPENESGEVSGGAIATGLGLGAASVAGAYFLTRSYPVSAGEGSAIVSAGTWGATELALFGDALSGRDSTSVNDTFKFMAAGGLLGMGGGVLYAYKSDPTTNDVALTNSLALWGVGSGLLLGVAISPPEGEAYSLNAAFGSVAGLTAGLILAPRMELDFRRTLWLNAGAAAGAAVPWILVYPLLADGTTNNDEQIAGGLSAFTLLGGVIGAYFLTDTAKPPRTADQDDGTLPLSPALLSRKSDGSWHLGAPPLRPMVSPRLAPAAGTAIGFDVAAGRF